MTLYVVLSNNGEVGSAFGEVARVEASRPAVAIRRAISDFGLDPDEDGPFAAVPERYFFAMEVGR